MGGPPAGKLRNQMLELKDDIGRIRKALVRIAEDKGWNKKDFFEDVETMVRKGISTNLLDLCKLPNITKGRAEFLYENGAYDESSLVGIMANIEDEVDVSFAEALKGIADEFRRKSR